MIIANFIIPQEQQQWLQLFKQILIPLSKLGILLFVCYKIYSVIKAYRSAVDITLSSFLKLKTAVIEVFPNRFGEILSLEIGVIYFLFKKKRAHNYIKNEFSYHGNQGITTTIAALAFIILLETVVVHWLIHDWNPLIAYLSSYSSLYLIILLISILRSRSHFPITIDYNNSTLRLQYGFTNQSTINIKDIESIEKSYKSNITGFMKLSNFNEFESHNLILHFTEPQVLQKAYGIKKCYTSIGIYVDNPEVLLQELLQFQNRESKI